MRLTIALAVVFVIDGGSRLAHACSFAGNGTHEKDVMHASDVTAPSVTTVDNLLIVRSDDSGGCGATRCPSHGVIMFTPTATDDATPAHKIGYQLTVVRGTPPRGLRLDDAAITPSGNEINAYFDYDAPDFDFDLEIRSVDLNGNLGPPAILQLVDAPEHSGCAAQRGVGWLVILAALAFAVRRRR